jgi:signal transduction histidine kinase/CheY-like chemotaxis protein/HAMP domain-containing protein
LTAQLRNIANVAIAVADGDLSKKITVDVRGEILQLKETINTMVDQLRAFASEVTRVAREVGTDGKLGGQAFVPGVSGIWKDLTDSVNQMSNNLTAQVRNIAEVTKAVAGGDLSKTVAIDVKGEMMDLKHTINTMVDQLNSFASEVTRVAREVGTEGKLGGQATVRGVGGVWKDLTDSVNQMASNLTGQVRGIAKVVNSVAKGVLKQKLSIIAAGEMAQLTETINEMIDTLAVFADQVTTVAREVGVEGRLGGQASVPGASGTWKDLTENVNQLAANLTTQVRSISEVASAVTKGDLTGTIRVDAKGELEALKDTINQMIANLRETTLRNQEQGWLKSNLAKFTQMLQGQRDLNTVTNKILSELAQVVTAHYGAFYILRSNSEQSEVTLKLSAAYAYRHQINAVKEFAIGESLVGQVATEKEKILLTNVPSEYIKIGSGLGEASPLNVIILPVLFETKVKAVIELASFEAFSQTHINFLEQLTESIGIVLNTIETNTRTEGLLAQSQSLADELRRTNEELQDKALLLVKQKDEVEAKNKEVEEARKSLEEKAEQLTLTSKYKSEFLANMSHELRTPLNSLLILAQQLYENNDGNLSDKQVKFAKTIYSCGDDLIQLINDILDLSKIESGFISAEIVSVRINDIKSFVEATFRPISEAKQLNFSIEMSNDLPEEIETDPQRLKQILKNLLSNAFKFTEKGEVKLLISKVNDAQNKLSKSGTQKEIIYFAIKDTGIGISKEKQQIVFEAFQQAEGSTSRKYGGTGLGLSISRGLAELLGGFIDLKSEPNRGSEFTLYIPLTIGKSKFKFQKQPSIENKLTSMLLSKSSLPEHLNKIEIKEIIEEVVDDRVNITAQDQVVLVVDDDVVFCKIMVDKAHEHGLKVVAAANYHEVFEFANTYQPIAITLDIKLPDTNGWKVLHLLKNDLKLRHIPVHVISGEENKSLAFHRGARSFLLKPLRNEDLTNLFQGIISFNKKHQKSLLVIEDNEIDASKITDFLGNGVISTTLAKNGENALNAISQQQFDAIILDYILPDTNGLDLIKAIQLENRGFTPVILYSAKEFTEKELKELRPFTQTVITKDRESLNFLLEETVAKLHIPFESLSLSKQSIIGNLRRNDDVIRGKNVLIVDDDVRNLFALTTSFEKFSINVITAESGLEAIAIINENPQIDIVLMDIMMPEMDGYETMERIRRESKNSMLPIIAVTAKAMKGDRQKCIEAGASDYITKPVKLDQLLSLMRIWLYKI